MRYRILALVLMTAVLGGGLFCGQAQATHAEVFAISGGTPEQQAVVREALEQSSWDWRWKTGNSTKLVLTDSHPPYWGCTEDMKTQAASGELAFPFLVAGDTVGVSYFPSGNIYIDARLTEPMLREVAMHEAAHSRVMFVWFWDRPVGADVYGCYALDAWRELIGAEGDVDLWEQSPVESHAEWFRVTYLDPAIQVHSEPRSELPGPPNGTADVVTFHDEWCPREDSEPEPEPEPEPRPEPLGPWSDIPPDDQELLAAAWWARDKNVFQGRGDGTFGVHAPTLQRHVTLVCERTGIPAPPWEGLYGTATRAMVRDAIPGLTWYEQRWDEPLTRSQLLRLVYRARDGLDPDAVVAGRLEAWFADTHVTWRGGTRAPRLIGYAQLLVQLSREHDVPLWLALGQCWRESQWGTTGLAINHNCLWGVKDVNRRWGEVDHFVGSSFASYVTLEECIRAYFRLIDSPVYRRFVDAGDWRGLLNKYAPPSDGNDPDEHYRIVVTVRGWCKARGIW